MLTKPMTTESNDDRLRLSRRLDWRFMFSNPTLKHVVVAGEPDGELILAVEMFSEQVIVWQGQLVETCDMLILRDPTISLLRRALETIQPERIYIEFNGRDLRLRWHRLLCLINAAFSAGWELRQFWHWPDVANANRVIPLFSSEPMSFVVTKGEKHLRARLMSTTFALLRGAGLLPILVNGLSITGERRV